MSGTTLQHDGFPDCMVFPNVMFNDDFPNWDVQDRLVNAEESLSDLLNGESYNDLSAEDLVANLQATIRTLEFVVDAVVRYQLGQ